MRQGRRKPRDFARNDVATCDNLQFALARECLEAAISPKSPFSGPTISGFGARKKFGGLVAAQDEDEHVRNFYVLAVATACEWADLPRTRGRRCRVG